MDQNTAPDVDGDQLTPEQLEDVAAGWDVAYSMVDQGDGTWAVVATTGAVFGVYPNQAMASELALYLNGSGPRPNWW